MISATPRLSRVSLSLAAAAIAVAAAASGEPARVVSGEVFVKLPGAANAGGGQIEIESYSWGAVRSAGLYGVSPLAERSYAGGDASAAGKVEHEWKVEEGESAPPAPGGAAKYGAVPGMHRDSSIAREMKESGEKGGTEDINIGVGELQEVGGARTETIGAARSRDAASGQATGKRQHKPIRMRAYDDASTAPAEKRQHGWVTVSKPLERGVVRVKVKTPWLACRVGARYPSLELGDGARTYRLSDVTVASCSGDADDRPTEEIAFYYNKIG